MSGIKIVSFDVEGTLVTTDFSYAIWFEAIPERYADRYDMPIDEARKAVMEEYQKIGDQRLEWYDIRYWFRKLDLGDAMAALESCQNRVSYYPEVIDVLKSLGEKYKLTAASGSPREFLHHLLRGIDSYLDEVFSSISDYQQLKTADFYHKLCRSLNVRPEEVVHIGDNWQFDFISAGEAGIHAFYLDRKSQDSHHPETFSTLTPLKRHLLEG
jgi:putative hydrolase of the HAD superfamily